MALGANPASLVRIVMAGALLQTVIGVVFGIALAPARGRALRAILFGVGPNDPAALVLSATLMLVWPRSPPGCLLAEHCGSIRPSNFEPTSQARLRMH